MATYVVSDIHGCFNTFRRLLDTLSFDETQDRLWLIGDIVNRGPASLSMLRWAQKHDHCLNMVLGNHDLHLLAVREGVVRACVHDTLAEVLAAPDADVLCEWLRRRPLAHAEGKWLLLHAGLLPDWNTNRALALAQEAATVIGGAHWRDFATEIYGDTPTRWDDSLSGNARWRTIVNVLTRLRICTPTEKCAFLIAARWKTRQAAICRGLKRGKNRRTKQRLFSATGRRWGFIGVRICCVWIAAVCGATTDGDALGRRANFSSSGGGTMNMSASKLQLSDSGRLLHLLTLEDLPPKIIYSLFAAADKFAAHKPSPDARPLSGKLFVNIFFESSTRTRTAFEASARQLGADVVNLDRITMSGETKSETLRDTVLTIAAMGAAGIALRHGENGAAVQAAAAAPPNFAVPILPSLTAETAKTPIRLRG